MLIYIVEDDGLKLERVMGFLSEFMPQHDCEVAASFQSGLRLVESRTPDLIILDMTLPTFDRAPNAHEGRLRPLGGYDLLRKLQLRKVETKVIVLSQLVSFGDEVKRVSFAEIIQRCKDEFPQIFVEGVYFDQSDISWQHSLLNLIAKLDF